MVIFEPPYGLTQTVTQTRKKAGGYRRTQWIARRAESAQKGRKALDTNAFRPSSYLHTQEVTGSSPAVSTKKFLISQEIRDFFAFMPPNNDAAFWRFSHDPNRDPKAERSGKRRRGADGIIRPSPAVFVGYMVWLMTLPMAFRIFSWVWRKESGSNMVPVLGDTNR